MPCLCSCCAGRRLAARRQQAPMPPATAQRRVARRPTRRRHQGQRAAQHVERACHFTPKPPLVELALNCMLPNDLVLTSLGTPSAAEPTCPCRATRRTCLPLHAQAATGGAYALNCMLPNDGADVTARQPNDQVRADQGQRAAQHVGRICHFTPKPPLVQLVRSTACCRTTWTWC
jgi:hypothetical protein